MSVIYRNGDGDCKKLLGKIGTVKVIYVCIVLVVAIALGVCIIVFGIKLGKFLGNLVTAYLTGNMCNTCSILIKSANYPFTPSMTGTGLGHSVDVIALAAGTEIYNVLVTVLRNRTGVRGKPLAPIVTNGRNYIGVNLTAISTYTLRNGIANTIAEACFVGKSDPIAPVVTGTLFKGNLFLTALGTCVTANIYSLTRIEIALYRIPIAPYVAGACIKSDFILITRIAEALLTVNELTGIHALEIVVIPLTPCVTGRFFYFVLGLAAYGTIFYERRFHSTVVSASIGISLIPLTPYVSGAGTQFGSDNAANRTGVSKENILCTVGSNLGNNLLPLTPYVSQSSFNLIIKLAASKALALELGSYGTIDSASIGVCLIPLTPYVAGSGLRFNLILIASGAETNLAIYELAGVESNVSRAPLAPSMTGTLVIGDLFFAANGTGVLHTVDELAGIKAIILYSLVPGMAGTGLGLVLGAAALGAYTSVIEI